MMRRMMQWMLRVGGKGAALLRRSGREELETLVSTTLGTFIVCFSIAALMMPYRFAGTGVSGIALITNYLWGISPAWVIGTSNVFLLAWGWNFLSPRFTLWTLYVSGLTTLVLPLFERFEYPTLDSPMLAAILAGITGGVGYGMFFRVDASSGGMDIVSMAARKRWGVDVGAVSFYINVGILFLSYTVVTLEQMLYGGLLLYIETLMIDNVVHSFNRRTQVLVISPRTSEIASFIMSRLERSATLIPARGAYRGTSAEMLLAVLPRRQVPPLKRHIASVDPAAFVIFSDVSEVVGEGFKSWLRA